MTVFVLKVDLTNTLLNELRPYKGCFDIKTDIYHGKVAKYLKKAIKELWMDPHVKHEETPQKSQRNWSEWKGDGAQFREITDENIF